MEIVTISVFGAKILKEYSQGKQPWIYCIIKSADQTFCSKNYQVLNKDWIELVGGSNHHQMEIPRGNFLFKIEIWSYDTKQKLGQTNIGNTDLPMNEREKQFSINDRKIHLKFIYERKQKVQQTRQVQSSALRIGYNKSDPNLKLLPNKPSSANVRKMPNPMEQIQNGPKYDPNSFGRWKFIPSSNNSNPQKLKL